VPDARDRLPDPAVVELLRHLLVVSHDSEAGYQHAALRVHDGGLREAFLTRARQRATFSAELRAALLGRGWGGDESGSAIASLHRTWLSAKAALHGGAPRTVLDECERGDRAALEAYEQVLVRPGLPRDVARLLESQWALVFETCERFRWLADPPAAILHPGPVGGAPAPSGSAWTRLLDRYRFWETKLEIEACARGQPEHLGALLDRLGLESLTHWRLVEDEVHRRLGADPAMGAIGRSVSDARLLALDASELEPAGDRDPT
jgi:uncharacterized protein (TIGR02284 family)